MNRKLCGALAALALVALALAATADAASEYGKQRRCRKGERVCRGKCRPARWFTTDKHVRRSAWGGVVEAGGQVGQPAGSWLRPPPLALPVATAARCQRRHLSLTRGRPRLPLPPNPSSAGHATSVVTATRPASAPAAASSAWRASPARTSTTAPRVSSGSARAGS